MSAGGEIHAHDGVARLKKHGVHGHVGLRAGMGLNIGKVGAEQLLYPFNGQIFHLVHILAAAVESGSGIAFGILVGEMAAHGLHHGAAGKVF